MYPFLSFSFWWSGKNTKFIAQQNEAELSLELLFPLKRMSKLQNQADVLQQGNKMVAS